MTSKSNTVKVAQWIIKVAFIAITYQATLQMMNTLQVAPVYIPLLGHVTLAQIAGVVMVEGFMIYVWLMMEYTIDVAARLAYEVMAGVMYMVMLYIGAQFSGALSWVPRLAAGLSLFAEVIPRHATEIRNFFAGFVRAIRNVNNPDAVYTRQLATAQRKAYRRSIRGNQSKFDTAMSTVIGRELEQLADNRAQQMVIDVAPGKQYRLVPTETGEGVYLYCKACQDVLRDKDGVPKAYPEANAPRAWGPHITGEQHKIAAGTLVEI